MTSPTVKVFDNQNTSSPVKIGGTLMAAIVILCLAVLGLGLIGAIIAAPFVIFGFTLMAIIVMIPAFPVLALGYYLLLILALPFVRHRANGTKNPD